MKNIDTIDYRNAVIRQQMMIDTALTGYINSNDERLIKEIQANYGLEPSGYVDYDTFLALKDNAEDKRVRELSKKLYGSEDGNLSEGSYGYSAERLNITLAHVIDGLGLRIRRPRGSIRRQ